MTKVVAVSGGVDSVVLLDILARGDEKLIVAHVDHGIRDSESAADARFVRALAQQYQLPYVETKLELGEDASEDSARSGRYTFLLEQAEKFGAGIVTAHHKDDVIGSMAINCSRGTGWRGVAVLNRQGTFRPLLGWTKAKIYEYALQNKLEWVEDATNQSNKYLRNRLRAGVLALGVADRRVLIDLRAKQLQLVRDIDREIYRLVQIFGDDRHPYIQIDNVVAIELLRLPHQLTYPQGERLLHALKTGRAGTRHDIGSGKYVRLTRQQFIVDSYPE